MSTYFVWTRKSLERRERLIPLSEGLLLSARARLRLPGAPATLAVELDDDEVARAAFPDAQQ